MLEQYTAYTEMTNSDLEQPVGVALGAQAGCSLSLVRTGNLLDGVHFIEIEHEERLVGAQQITQLVQHVQLQRGHVRLTPAFSRLFHVLLELNPPVHNGTRTYTKGSMVATLREAAGAPNGSRAVFGGHF